MARRLMTAPGTVKLCTDMMTMTNTWVQTDEKPASSVAGEGAPSPTSRLDSDLGFRAASALPSGLAQTLEQVGVVSGRIHGTRPRTCMSNEAAAIEISFSHASIASTN